MGVVAISLSVDVDVAVRQQLKLLQTASSSGIDGEENGPCDACTDEGDDDHGSEEAQEQVGVEGVVVEHEGVWQREELLDPSEHARLRLGGLLVVSEAAQIGTRLVKADPPEAEPEEEAEVNASCNKKGKQSGKQAGERSGRIFIIRVCRFILLHMIVSTLHTKGKKDTHVLAGHQRGASQGSGVHAGREEGWQQPAKELQMDERDADTKKADWMSTGRLEQCSYAVIGGLEGNIPLPLIVQTQQHTQAASARAHQIARDPSDQLRKSFALAHTQRATAALSLDAVCAIALSDRPVFIPHRLRQALMARAAKTGASVVPFDTFQLHSNYPPAAPAPMLLRSYCLITDRGAEDCKISYQNIKEQGYKRPMFGFTAFVSPAQHDRGASGGRGAIRVSRLHGQG
ncbi:hypothetical protein FH972_022506 [Carpinus fangiana]|uniref:Uncharacterized protein n=1 Tax=Carpinus fangiana TaxID=176857 RepID=A0A5N6KSU5_9ROSI|nr:hypothetical protein FH972_022506 [Carpinus fangiana]